MPTGFNIAAALVPSVWVALGCLGLPWSKPSGFFWLPRRCPLAPFGGGPAGTCGSNCLPAWRLACYPDKLFFVCLLLLFACWAGTVTPRDSSLHCVFTRCANVASPLSFNAERYQGLCVCAFRLLWPCCALHEQQTFGPIRPLSGASLDNLRHLHDPYPASSVCCRKRKLSPQEECNATITTPAHKNKHANILAVPAHKNKHANILAVPAVTSCIPGSGVKNDCLDFSSTHTPEVRMT